MSVLTKWIIERINCDGPMSEQDLHREVKDAIRDLVDGEVLDDNYGTVLSLTDHGDKVARAIRNGEIS